MKTIRGLYLAALFLMASVVPVIAHDQAPRSPDQRPAAPSPAGQPQPFSWWKSEPVKKDLGLTADQSARIDKIWESTRPELRQEWDELSKLEAKLSRLIQNDADESAVSRQIDRVETARANANKTRSLMLVQMRRVLTSDQRTRLDAIHSQWQKDQRPPQAQPPQMRPQPQMQPPPDSRKPRQE